MTPVLTEEQKAAARLLVNVQREHNLPRHILIYFDSAYCAVYPLGDFADWIFIDQVNKEVIQALNHMGFLDLGFHAKLGMDVITFKKAIFTAEESNFSPKQ